MVKDDQVLVVGFWNMLADGLSQGEFMTRGGDIQTTAWNARKHKIVDVLVEMLYSCDIVGVAENDHFHWILGELNRRTGNNVKGIHSVEKAKLKASPAFKFKTRDPGQTFQTECGEYTDRMAGLYGATPQDPFVVDDGVSLYYLSDRVQLLQPDLTPHGLVTLGTHKHMVAKFQLLFGERTEQVVAVAHLASGDSEKDETKRVAGLKALFAEPQLKLHKKNAVILMDSNFSSYYTKPLQEGCDQVIERAGWVNCIKEDGNECFKMRHAKGGQPKKFGELMFDAIDKILVSKEASTATEFCTNLINFKRSLCDQEERSRVEAVRTNADLRKKLKEACTKGEWPDDNSCITLDPTLSGMLTVEIVQQLYPNPCAPSDHPPIMASIIL